jgi:nucleotide-binding universal stress UspA family protein
MENEAHRPASTIVVGLEGGSLDNSVLRWAIAAAMRSNASLRLVHCDPYVSSLAFWNAGAYYTGVAAPEVEIEREAAETARLMKGYADTVAELAPTIATETVITRENVPGALTNESKTADLMVLGSRRLGVGRAWLFNSHAHALAHRSSCPVVLVGEGVNRVDPLRVIVGLDDSDGARAALSWAAEQAKQLYVPLNVIHAWEYPYLGLPTGVGPGRSLLRDEAAKFLDAWVVDTQERHPECEVVATLLEADPVTALSRHATADDLLVVGARGRGLLRSAMLGSTSGQLIEATPGALAIVRRQS